MHFLTRDSRYTILDLRYAIIDTRLLIHYFRYAFSIRDSRHRFFETRFSTRDSRYPFLDLRNAVISTRFSIGDRWLSIGENRYAFLHFRKAFFDTQFSNTGSCYVILDARFPRLVMLNEVVLPEKWNIQTSCGSYTRFSVLNCRYSTVDICDSQHAMVLDARFTTIRATW